MAPLRHGFLALALFATGCGGGATPLSDRKPSDDPQGHIRALGVQYMQYQGKNGGKLPPNEAALKKHLGAQADAALVSPRDNQPYVVRYGVVSKGVPGGGAGDVVLYEKTGVQGKRYAATSMGTVQELDETELKKLVPEFK